MYDIKCEKLLPELSSIDTVSTLYPPLLNKITVADDELAIQTMFARSPRLDHGLLRC